MKKIIYGIITALLSCIIIICFMLFFKTIYHKKQSINDTPLINNENKVENMHSEFYNPNVSVDDIILYFNEIAFGAEYINDGNPYKLQKWNEAIYYIIIGDYTSEDLVTLSTFIDWLNTIEGFPGIYETKDLTKANLKINFCTQDTLVSIMGSNFEKTDGAVTFWYENDIIYDAVIYYRTDLNQHLRNSVIIEEIYNGLGFINDTNLRTDSIIYSEFSEPQELTEIDKILLKILYNKELKNGMNADECEQVIRTLYY